VEGELSWWRPSLTGYFDPNKPSPNPIPLAAEISTDNKDYDPTVQGGAPLPKPKPPPKPKPKSEGYPPTPLFMFPTLKLDGLKSPKQEGLPTARDAPIPGVKNSFPAPKPPPPPPRPDGLKPDQVMYSPEYFDKSLKGQPKTGVSDNTTPCPPGHMVAPAGAGSLGTSSNVIIIPTALFQVIVCSVKVQNSQGISCCCRCSGNVSSDIIHRRDAC